MKKIVSLIVILMMVFSISGCGNLFNYEPEKPITVTKFDGEFDNEDEILTLMKEFGSIVNNLGRNSWLEVDMGEEAVAMDDGGDSTKSGSDDYSETNTQVVGVDEMDNVVTDGMYMYIVNGNKVEIILAYTNETLIEEFGVVKTLEYYNTSEDCNYVYKTVRGLYVDSNNLYVVMNVNNNTCEVIQSEDGKEYKNYSYINETEVIVYEKDNFEEVDRYTLAGYLVGTRKIDSVLYVITNNYIRSNWTYNEETEEYDVDYFVEESLPYYKTGETVVNSEYSQVIYEDGTDPNSFMSFFGIDTEQDVIDMEVVLGDSGYNLYVSNENMYLAGTDYSSWWFMDIALEEDQTDEEPDYTPQTKILKMNIDGVDLSYKASATIDGVTLNQFSMDEYEGNLRVTTTTQNWWWWWNDTENETINTLYVLDENLEVLSSLSGLGKPGETIQSTRFAGDYAYVVTFERTDPFYVINVSDPTNPFVEGELEIPGFSSYLQPLGNDHILGIGFDADSEGRTTGLKLSIYDISDKTNPTVFDEVVFGYGDHGWAWSSSTYNHKDLIVDLNKGIIAFPMTMCSYTEDYSKWSYESGVMIYNIDLEEGLSFNGFMKSNTTYDYYWRESVYKGQFIADYFYTISHTSVSVALISDLDTVLDTVVYEEYEYHYYEKTDEEVIEDDVTTESVLLSSVLQELVEFYELTDEELVAHDNVLSFILESDVEVILGDVIDLMELIESNYADITDELWLDIELINGVFIEYCETLK